MKSKQSWHYPPVKHDWSAGSDKALVEKFAASDDEDSNNYDLHLQDSYELDERVALLQSTEISPNKKIRPHIFR